MENKRNSKYFHDAGRNIMWEGGREGGRVASEFERENVH